MVKNGGDTWYFITADYAFGHDLAKDATFVVLNGGKVLGSVRHPLNSSDFSSYLLQAQASGAKVIGLANAGGDTINAMKQASEFGLIKSGQKLSTLLAYISDIESLGLEPRRGCCSPRPSTGTSPTKHAPGRSASWSNSSRCRPLRRPASIPRPCII